MRDFLKGNMPGVLDSGKRRSMGSIAVRLELAAPRASTTCSTMSPACGRSSTSTPAGHAKLGQGSRLRWTKVSRRRL